MMTNEGRNMNSSTIYDRMLKRYMDIYSKNEKPTDMFNLPPAIPFIGKRYHNMSPKIISYASAENLSDYYDDELKPTDSKLHQLETREQINRARYYYSNHSGDFPHIHIEPFNTGNQLLITRHILTKLGYNSLFETTPFGFIEQIVAANPGKFSIAVKGNKDYASDPQKMNFSINYIQEDLNLLKPNIVILPGTIFKTIDKLKKWKTMIREANLPSVNFVQIVQLSSLNNPQINREINGLPHPDLHGEPYGKWFDLVKSRKVATESFYSWVDNELFKYITVTV
jgi:hypothetical protein